MNTVAISPPLEGVTNQRFDGMVKNNPGCFEETARVYLYDIAYLSSLKFSSQPLSQQLHRSYISSSILQE